VKNQVKWKVFITDQNISSDLQNRRVASSGVTGGFDSHSLPPFIFIVLREHPSAAAMRISCVATGDRDKNLIFGVTFGAPAESSKAQLFDAKAARFPIRPSEANSVHCLFHS
jgi:hypothetical protein